MCVHYGRSSKTCLVVHVPNCALKGQLQKDVITYKVLDEAGASLVEEETYLVMSSWARVVHFRDAVFAQIRSHLAENAGPEDLTEFRDHDAFIWGEPLEPMTRIVMQHWKKYDAEFVVMVANKALKGTVSSRNAFFKVVGESDTPLMDTAGCIQLNGGSRVVYFQDAAHPIPVV